MHQYLEVTRDTMGAPFHHRRPCRRQVWGADLVSVYPRLLLERRGRQDIYEELLQRQREVLRGEEGRASGHCADYSSSNLVSRCVHSAGP